MDEQNELKTLKDIADYECQDCGYDSKELRQAAIEHYKDQQRKIDLINEGKVKFVYPSTPEQAISICSSIQFWIKNFFNLREEDLK